MALGLSHYFVWFSSTEYFQDHTFYSTFSKQALGHGNVEEFAGPFPEHFVYLILSLNEIYFVGSFSIKLQDASFSEFYLLQARRN